MLKKDIITLKTESVFGKKNEKNCCEICVCCKRKMNILINVEIAQRAFYIEGAGQLCYDCYHKIYLQV